MTALAASTQTPAPTDSPTTPAEVVEQVGEAVGEQTSRGWEFLLGTPLRVTVIIVIAVVVAVVVRHFIKRFAGKIASGATAAGDERRRGSLDVIRMDAKTRARRAQRASTVGSLLSSVAAIVISVIAAMMVLTELGFNLAPVLASAGIAGVAIGFGAQTLVKDYLSGFFLVIEDQYGIGDFVDLGEAIGTVEEVGLRTTKVRDLDGTLWHVRNGEILRVGNQSQGWSRAVLDVPVPYEADEAEVRALIEDTLTAMRKDRAIDAVIIEEPEIVGIQQLTGESVIMRTIVKTKPAEQWGVTRAFRAEVKRQMDRRGMAIPLLQQSVIRTGASATKPPAADAGEPEEKA